MITFEPTLTLAKEPDGEYTLRAVTIAPNSCYSAGRAVIGPPPQVRLMAEVLPVMLDVRVRKGMCMQALTPVRHEIGNLKLGPQHGKTSVLAFLMMNGSIAGTASLRVDEPGTSVNEQPRPVDTTDWYAWLDKMPPGPASFHVVGNVVLPSPGNVARLVRAAPQGINPAELILDLAIERLPGFWPQVVTTVNVRFDESPAGIAYTGVLVRVPGGGDVHLEVETVH